MIVLFLLQISQISAECNIEVDSQETLNERQSDDNIPLLPQVIRTIAGALRGGPFAYNGMILSITIGAVMYYTDQGKCTVLLKYALD